MSIDSGTLALNDADVHDELLDIAAEPIESGEDSLPMPPVGLPDGDAADACDGGGAPYDDPVWKTDSVSVSITEIGATFPPAFAECTDASITWSFDSRAGTLGKTGCENGKVINRTTHLSADQQAQIVASLHTMRNNVIGSTIADGPEINVAVTNAQGTVSMYSGFPWFLPSCRAPTLDSMALIELGNLMDHFVDIPRLLGEWCNDADQPCAPGLSCGVDSDAGFPDYCRDN